MNKAVSEDIVNYLETNDFGIVGDDLFGMEWGADVNEQILVMDVESNQVENKDHISNVNFQLLCRGEQADDARNAYNKLKAVHDFLITQSDKGVDIGGTVYLGFHPRQGDLIALGRDKNDRYVFSINYFTFRNPS